MDWTALFQGLGIGGVLIAAFTYLAKTSIETFLNRNLKSFEAELKNKNEQSLEEFRHSLHLVEKEHELKFSKLHERKAEIVAELYKLLKNASKKVESFLRPMGFASEPSKDKKAEEAFESLFEFIEYYDMHKIYFRKELCETIDEFIDQIRKPTYKFNRALRHKGNPSPEKLGKLDQVWDESWDSFKDKVQPSIKAIEEEFRKILGVI